MQKNVIFFRQEHRRYFVFLIIQAPKMGHSKTIYMNTLFVANAYLPNYLSNNVNALITFIVHYFLIVFHVFRLHTSFCSYGERAPPPPPSRIRGITYLLFVNLEDMWSCCVCLERTTLTDADGNIASRWCNAAVLQWQ